jgi:hypothetical protein
VGKLLLIVIIFSSWFHSSSAVAQKASTSELHQDYMNRYDFDAFFCPSTDESFRGQIWLEPNEPSTGGVVRGRVRLTHGRSGMEGSSFHVSGTVNGDGAVQLTAGDWIEKELLLRRIFRAGCLTGGRPSGAALLQLAGCASTKNVVNSLRH